MGTEIFDPKTNFIFESFCQSFDYYLFISDLLEDNTRWSPNTVMDFDIPGEYMKDTNRLWRELIHPEDRHFYDESFQAIYAGLSDLHFCEYRVKNRRGEYLWVRCRGYISRLEDGTPYVFIGLVNRLDTQNKIDSITQLRSVSELYAAIQGALDSNFASFGLLLIGLDNFSVINTVYSYSFGDMILRNVGELLQSLCPPGCALYHGSGDSFVYMCHGGTQEQLALLFKQARETLTRFKFGDGAVQYLSVSGGALIMTPEYKSLDTVRKNLLHALSISKAREKGTVTFFSPELLELSLENLKLQEALKHCVLNDFEGFELYFQPITDGITKKLLSCEALLRWNHEGFPSTGPDIFIPILEETGMIAAVGKWVLTRSLEQLKLWREKLPSLHINVNVSYLQLKEPGFSPFVVEELDRLSLPHDCLTLELTESCEIQNFDYVRTFSDFLHREGISLALDDFGTGYASLSVLREVNTDWIKLDQTFVSKITDSSLDRSIMQYLIKLCHSLQLKVCAEGVESELCCDLVHEQEAEALQGYYFSRPVPAGDFEKEFIADPS